MNQPEQTDVIIDCDAINGQMEAWISDDPLRAPEILAKALELKGLDPKTSGSSLELRPDLLEELFHTARSVKEAFTGPRIVLFAPLYISNLCENNCLYCGFRAENRE